MKCFFFDFYTFTDEQKNVAKIVIHQQAENKLKAMREVFDTSKTGFRLCLHKPYQIEPCIEHNKSVEPEENPWGS